MQTTINTYQCVSKPTVLSITTLTDWLILNKQSQYSSLIESARKGGVDSGILKEVLPCVTYNFTYNGYKKDENIISSTGIIYIDIDNPEFNINSLDLNKVYSYYHSVRGKGYSLLVKVEGVTIDNFKSTYKSIIDELGITEFIDINAVKHSQFNILSYDPNLYINPNSYTFPSVDILTPPSMVNKEKYIYPRVGGKIQYNNNSTYTLGLKPDEYVCDWTNGFEHIKSWIPFSRKIKVNYRYQFLLSYGTNFLYNNITLDFYGVLNNLKHVNLIACEVPIEESQLVKISKTLIKQRTDGVLKPIIFNKRRKVIFAENSTLTRDEKRKVVNTESANYWRGVSTNKMLNIIEDWDFEQYGKITQASMVKNHPITKKTVEKYWSGHKEYIAALNAEFNTKEMKIVVPIEPLEQTLVTKELNSTTTNLTTLQGFNYYINETNIDKNFLCDDHNYF